MLRSLLWAAGATLAAACAHAQGVTPYLRVETGVHQAVINRLALLPGGDGFVSVSDDKTARLWSVDGLKALGVVRPPIGPGDDGSLVGAAVSGNVLAVAGRVRVPGGTFAVQFYHLPDLKFAGALTTLPAPASALRIAPDKRTLLVGMVGGQGLRAYDLHGNGAQVAADPAYGGQVQWIDADAQGRVVTSGEDGRIRLYAADHHRIASVALPDGGRPYAVAFSPDGKSVAVGNQAGAKVWLLDAATLRPQKSFSGAAGRSGGFSVVAFTPSGDALLGAGTYKIGTDGHRLVRRWPIDGSTAEEFDAGTDTVTDLVPVGQDVIVADGEPAIERLDAHGAVVARQASRTTDFRDYGLRGFGVSHDGSLVEVPVAGATGRMVFDVRARAMRAATAEDALVRPSDSGGLLRATAWRNLATPRLNNRLVPLEQDERTLAVAIPASGEGAAFGTNFFIRYVRPNGTFWHSVVPAPAWAVNVSPDGAMVIAGLGDGTVRWLDAGSGRELMTLFIEPASGHWVLSTADGYFDHDVASNGQPDGRSLIGYQFNDLNGQTSRFVDVGQLYPAFYRPDLVGLAVRHDRLTRQTVEHARDTQPSVAAVLDRGLPATVSLLEICDGGPDGKTADCRPAPPAGVPRVTTADKVVVRFRLDNADGDPGRASIFRNGAAIAPPLATLAQGDHSRVQEAVIPLGAGSNELKVRAISSSGDVEGAASVGLAVMRAPDTPIPNAAPAPGGPQRTLFLLSAGISHFHEPRLDLANADNDARAMAALMGRADPPLYTATEVTALYDDQATLEHIVAGMQAIAEKAQPDDLVLIFFAGHGEEVDGRYYFAPADFGTRNPDLLARALVPPPAGQSDPEGDAALDEVFRREGLGPDRMLPQIQAIRAARVAIILDTCYSGSLATQDTVFQHDANRTVTNTIGHATGRFVLSSATTLALDSSDAGSRASPDGMSHGMFTSYLLDALEGHADLLHVGRVNVVQLADYTIAHVRQATSGRGAAQEPTFYFSGSEFFALKTDKLVQ